MNSVCDVKTDTYRYLTLDRLDAETFCTQLKEARLLDYELMHFCKSLGRYGLIEVSHITYKTEVHDPDEWMFGPNLHDTNLNNEYGFLVGWSIGQARLREIQANFSVRSDTRRSHLQYIQDWSAKVTSVTVEKARMYWTVLVKMCEFVLHKEVDDTWHAPLSTIDSRLIGVFRKGHTVPMTYAEMFPMIHAFKPVQFVSLWDKSTPLLKKRKTCEDNPDGVCIG
jgi:hypothetical protein